MSRAMETRLARLELRLKPETGGVLILRRYEDDTDEFFDRLLQQKQREIPGGPSTTIVIGNFGTRAKAEAGERHASGRLEALQ